MCATRETIPVDLFKSRMAKELLVILALGVVVYLLAAHYDALEHIVTFARQHENWELDEIIALSLYFVLALAVFSLRRWREVRKSKRDLSRSYRDLQNVLIELKQLRGILPICASCKKIRDDEGYWHQVEVYLRDHTEAEFSHSICPDCLRKLYPELIENGG